MLIVKPGGLHYDVEMKEIAAITPRPVFLPVLRLLEGVVEYEEATGTLVTGRWQQRNRRVSATLSPIFYLFLAPSGKLYLKVQDVLAHDEAHDVSHPPMISKRRPGPKHPKYGIPTEHWPLIIHRVVEQKEPLRTVAAPMVSRMKRSVAFFFICISSVDSKKRNGPGTFPTTEAR